MNIIQELEQEQVAKLSANREIPDFEPGDTTAKASSACYRSIRP